MLRCYPIRPFAPARCDKDQVGPQGSYGWLAMTREWHKSVHTSVDLHEMGCAKTVTQQRKYIRWGPPRCNLSELNSAQCRVETDWGATLPLNSKLGMDFGRIPSLTSSSTELSCRTCQYVSRLGCRVSISDRPAPFSRIRVGQVGVDVFVDE